MSLSGSTPYPTLGVGGSLRRMGRCPFANWRGENLPNETPHAQIQHRGLVLHVQQGNEQGTDSWFHNPASQASSHFGVAQDGTLDQWVDTDDKAWAEAAGNPYWVSVEIAGFSGQPATPAQVTKIAQLFAWLNEVYGCLIEQTDDPNGQGLGWHGMGGAAWGGHLDCPGQPIKDQRAEILKQAWTIRLGQNPGPITPVPTPGPSPAPGPAPSPAPAPGPAPQEDYVPGTVSPGSHGQPTKNVQGLLTAHGLPNVAIDGDFGPLTRSAVEAFQHSVGLVTDGIVGPHTWRALLGG